MKDDLHEVEAALRTISDTDAFEEWVRRALRRVLPHAAFLATVGKLYGIGSVPTHRISVDFPLSMVEELKNNAGALDDPLMSGWIKSERPRHVLVDELDEFGNQQQWRSTLLSYGIKSMTIHGYHHHSTRRFAAFQICNPCCEAPYDSVKILSMLVIPMAEAVFAGIDRRASLAARFATGHPTLSLTATELQIVEMLAQGLSNKEIARRRGVSDSTVKTQVQRTGAKLGATRRSEIVAIAMPLLCPLPPQTLVDYGDL